MEYQAVGDVEMPPAVTSQDFERIEALIQRVVDSRGSEPALSSRLAAVEARISLLEAHLPKDFAIRFDRLEQSVALARWMLGLLTTAVVGMIIQRFMVP